MSTSIKNILFFGAYNQIADDRAVLLEKGLNRNGIKVIHCRTETRKSKLSEIVKLPLQYWDLATKYFSIRDNYDGILVAPMIGHFDVFLIRILEKVKRFKKPIVFDAFLSIYDTMIVDRKLFNKNKLIESFLGKIFLVIDRLACRLSDRVILDTKEHAKYFKDKIGVPDEKLSVVYEGVNDDAFKPRQYKKYKMFTVLFYASIRPFHGLEYILKAAKILKDKDIVFEILGEGQDYLKFKKYVKVNGLKNVKLRGWVNVKEIPKYIARTHVNLGLFGDTPKAYRVIPNKAVHTLAMGGALITGDTPAAREVFTSGKDCVLVNMANEKKLADAILLLYTDRKLLNNIANEGHRLFNRQLNTEMIGKQLLSIFKEFI